MGLKDKIQKIVAGERARLNAAAQTGSDAHSAALIKAHRLVDDEIRPMLDDLLEATRGSGVRVEFRENFAGVGDVTTIVHIGNVNISDDGSSSDVGWTDTGRWWTFWPCFAADGQVTWSFCDGPRGHKWFESSSDLFANLVPSVAKEIAKRQHEAD